MADSCSNLDQREDMSSEDCVLLIKQGFEALMPTIRSSNSLPKDQQWDLFCTSPIFKPTMNSLGNKALDLMATILQNQGLYSDIRKRDLEEKYELIVEANDKILERVSTHLDELSGIRRNPTQAASDMPVYQAVSASGSWNRDVTSSAAWKEKKLRESYEKTIVLRNARVTQRPQLKFMDKIDNSNTPFDPRIIDKPNALKPLAVLLETLPNEDSCYSHPYEFELERFQEKIDSLNLAPKKVQLPRPFSETPFLMVTQEDELMDLLQDLKTQTEIAVDLEHHSYRTFQGFTCLLQISTRQKDYVVDTLLLRHKLCVLNEVFTHPNIVKVFHGAESDIQWLQRDLCLYVVNMFDTYQAGLLLSLPKLSLAYLLKTYCNIDANKHFQLYDWRTRPLSEEAVKYAREDTHYLLYIFDVLWNLLLERSNGGTQMLQSVLFRSTDTCKKRYWKVIFKEDSYENFYQQSRKNFDNRQMYALKEIYAWRDKIAREEDESTGYVLPNHMLLLIAEKLPKEMQGVLACCNPIPPLVRQNLVLLHQIILKAREQPLVVRTSLGMNTETRARPAPQSSVNVEGALHCPHDMTHNVDFRDNLPTLLTNPSIDTTSDIHLLEKQPQVKIFGDKDDLECLNILQMKLPNQTHFMSPFERYRKMLMYLESEENKTKEDKEKEIMDDTQKLLDECMKERLRQQATGLKNIEDSNEVKNIKTENEDLPNSRKRLSQDSEECTIYENSKNTTLVKVETISEPEDKSKKIYNTFLRGLKLMPPQEIKTEDNTPYRDHPPKKKKKLKSQEVISMNVGADNKVIEKKVVNDITTNKPTSGNSSHYDYSQVDYNQFHSQTQNSLTPKRSQDKFKQKGKKKQQNKSFTFARQYGNASSKKF